MTTDKQFSDDEIAALVAGITPGELMIETVRNDGAYGSGENLAHGFVSYLVLDQNGDVVCDTLNSTLTTVTEEDDQAWDEVGRKNMSFFAAAPSIVKQLLARVGEVEAEVADLKNRSNQTVLFECGCMFKQEGLDAEPMLVVHCVDDSLATLRREREELQAALVAQRKELSALHDATLNELERVRSAAKEEIERLAERLKGEK